MYVYFLIMFWISQFEMKVELNKNLLPSIKVQIKTSKIKKLILNENRDQVVEINTSSVNDTISMIK